MTLARAALLAVIGCIGCGRGTPEPEMPAPALRGADEEPPVEGPLERGRATYYADSLAGHATASGEPYDPGKMTAAHRTLPLGSVVHVIRDDGRFVEVRVNDRGPFGGHGAIVDLSRAAAERLGMMRAGIVDVRVRVVYLAPARKRR